MVAAAEHPPRGASTTSISDGDFDWFRRFIYDRSAIVLEPDKRYLVELRLEPLARQQGLPNVAALIGAIRSGADRSFEVAAVEALTTNETSFFRDQKPFEALREEILPEIIEIKRPQRTLRIWSAASSTGQEPYSLAILLNEHFPELATWDVQILGTDICHRMVERCQAGTFSQLEVQRGLSATQLTHFFVRDRRSWQASEKLTRLLSFQQMNLAARWPTLPRMDLVLLRNVLIYFDLQTKTSILRRLRDVMLPHAYLLLGAAETTVAMETGLTRHRRGAVSCYRP